jgi:hypothetical protein
MLARGGPSLAGGRGRDAHPRTVRSGRGLATVRGMGEELALADRHPARPAAGCRWESRRGLLGFGRRWKKVELEPRS